MTAASLSLYLPSFGDGEHIPAAYTCDGKQINPTVEWSDVPLGAKSLALIMTDPDIPDVYKKQMNISEYVHWILFNIPPEQKGIPENDTVGIAGANGGGEMKYTGPCPPPQYEPSEHRYIFTLYALDTMLDVPAGATKAQVEKAMEGHILAQAQYVGRYKRP